MTDSSAGVVPHHTAAANDVINVVAVTTTKFELIPQKYDGTPVFGGILQNSHSADYTTALGDANKHQLHPLADNNPRTFTIDSNANVPYQIGTAITFVNEINTLTIAITADTMKLAGAGTTGSRTLAVNGIATAIKTDTATWWISGTALT